MKPKVFNATDLTMEIDPNANVHNVFDKEWNRLAPKPFKITGRGQDLPKSIFEVDPTYFDEEDLVTKAVPSWILVSALVKKAKTGEEEINLSETFGPQKAPILINVFSRPRRHTTENKANLKISRAIANMLDIISKNIDAKIVGDFIKGKRGGTALGYYYIGIKVILKEI